MWKNTLKLGFYLKLNISYAGLALIKLNLYQKLTSNINPIKSCHELSTIIL